VADILGNLAGAKYFSVMDLASGYWQVPVKEQDKYKTAFITPFGVFEFNVMPFGLRNAPATFQALMNEVLGDLINRGCAVYLDDIIVYSSTFKQHVDLIAQVLHRMRKANLHLRLKKCRFALQEVTYLGHRISATGIAPLADKVRAVQEFPTPRDVKQLRSFLGLVTFYARFIPALATTARPLHELLRKNAPNEWTDTHQRAFQALKDALTSAPILAHPDFDRPFLLETDASDVGISAILSQPVDPNWDGKSLPRTQVVEYASRTLLPAETRYSAREKEALAVVWGIRHYSHYLQAAPFHVFTDHSSLRQLMSTKDPTGRLARWIATLQEYAFTVHYRKGSHAQNADALSRAPLLQQVADSSPTIEWTGDLDDARATPLVLTEAPPSPAPHTGAHKDNAPFEPQHWLPAMAEVAREQQRDPELQAIISALQDEKGPAQETKNGGRYVLLDGVLHHAIKADDSENKFAPARLRLVVPVTLRRRFIEAFHATSLAVHPGRSRTEAQVTERFFWPGMIRDVRNFVKSCEVCARTKTTASTKQGLLQPIFSERPGDIVGLDLFGPFPKSASGNTICLTMVDHFTHWVELIPLPNQSAAAVADAFFDNWVTRYGCPKRLITDQGAQFKAELFARLTRRLGIEHKVTTPYHPQSDGFTERQHRTIKAALQACVADNQTDWDSWLPAVAFTLRSTPIDGLGLSPFEVLFGYAPRHAMDAMLAPTAELPADPLDRYQRLPQVLNAVHKRVRDWQRRSKAKNKENYDDSRETVLYQPGDQVLLYTPPHQTGLATKLLKSWSTPMVVEKALSPINYVVRNPVNGATQTVHVQRLARWQPVAPQGKQDEPAFAAGPAVEAPNVTRRLEPDNFVIVRNDRNAQRGFVARVISRDKLQGTLVVHAYNSASKAEVHKRKYLPSHYATSRAGKQVEIFSSKPPPGFEPYIQLVDELDVVAGPFQLEPKTGRVPEHVIATLPAKFML
jgi:transposase InsO family protein